MSFSYLLFHIALIYLISYCSDFYFIMSYLFLCCAIHHASCFITLLFTILYLEPGVYRNILSTSLEVAIWTAYILPSPDPTLWEYTRFVVVVIVYNYLSCTIPIFIFFSPFPPSF